MTDKVTIKPEQVVSRKGAYIQYIDEGSTLRKAKSDTVIVLAEGEVAPPVPETVLDRPKAYEEVPASELPELGEGNAVVQENTGPAPATESKPKPSKRGNKQKENPEMATSAAAKKSTPKAKAKAPAPKPAKAKVHVRKEGGASVRTIGGKPVDLSRYEKAKAPGGGTSYNNGDAIAEKLQGKDLDAVYDIVARALKVEVKELRKKYGALNPGMQRMNLGNRLRKVLLPKDTK